MEHDLPDHVLCEINVRWSVRRLIRPLCVHKFDISGKQRAIINTEIKNL